MAKTPQRPTKKKSPKESKAVEAKHDPMAEMHDMVANAHRSASMAHRSASEAYASKVDGMLKMVNDSKGKTIF